MDEYEGRRKPKRWAKRCEQNCMAVVKRLPLVLVYGLTTWAVWVLVGLCLHWAKTESKGYIALFFGAVLYALANWSYTTCAFTDPGSPLNTSPGHFHNYSELPSHEPPAEVSSLTVKATGGARFCKKCQCKKPDRAHHCSSCKRCVLKMDHHCPWLATCVGFRNYKSFILFIGYTTIFCYVCFGVSASFVWTEIANEAMLRNGGAMLGINMVLLAVLSGIIGLVLTGFTGWHISLAIRNQTTIECLEKNRYAAPVKKTLQKAVSMPNGEDVGLMQRYGQQLAEIHANAIPGVTRIEEGEERSSDPGHPSDQLTAMEALRMNYNDMERQREEERYQDYLDEKESEKLPNAFDLGWKRNLSTLFGDNKLLWLLPICNTKGDGWRWEASPKWLAAQTALQQAREEQWQAAEARQGWSQPQNRTRLSAPTSQDGRRSPNKADRILGRTAGQYSDGGTFNGRPSSEMSMQTLKKHDHDETSSLDGLYDNEDAYDVSSDEASGFYGHGNRHGYSRRD